MGCDIHMYAEVRSTSGNWEKVGEVFTNTWYDPDSETKTYSDGYVWNAPKTDRPYDDRNYALFAILADVRNGYGFAGVVTHQPVKPLFADRGIPENASAEYLETVEEWGVDGHSHTYATLAELKAVDWKSIGINRVGFLQAKEYERMRAEGGNPQSWCGDVSGGSIVKVTPEVYEREYRGLIDQNQSRYVYIQWFWSETLDETLGSFITTTIPELSKLTENNLPDDSGKALERVITDDDVRIVFFFDN